MIIPLLTALIPTLVGFAEKLLPQPEHGDQRKELIMQILDGLYDKYLKGHLPDVPGVDEKAITMEIASVLVDFVSKKVFT